MNDIQLYNYYLSIPLATVTRHSWIYPKYVKITGKSITGPHPHRYLSFNEFMKVKEDFKNSINDVSKMS